MGRPLWRRSSCLPRSSRRLPLVVRQQGRTHQSQMRWPVLSWNRRVDRPEVRRSRHVLATGGWGYSAWVLRGSQAARSLGTWLESSKVHPFILG